MNCCQGAKYNVPDDNTVFENRNYTQAITGGLDSRQVPKRRSPFSRDCIY